MNHTFEMKLFGMDFEVSGMAWKGSACSADCPASEPEFEIETLTHKEGAIRVDDLSDGMLLHIELAALKSMKG